MFVIDLILILKKKNLVGLFIRFYKIIKEKEGWEEL